MPFKTVNIERSLSSMAKGRAFHNDGPEWAKAHHQRIYTLFSGLAAVSSYLIVKYNLPQL